MIQRSPNGPRATTVFGLDRLRLRRATGAATWQRDRLTADWPAAVYAVGDVHGSLRELLELESRIEADAAGVAGSKLIVMLGDYVDRGPASAGVIDHLMAAPPAGFERICLTGNHEAMLLDFLAAPRMDSPWLRYGGRECLRSYGIELAELERRRGAAVQQYLQACLPTDHLQWLTQLPVSLQIGSTLFVHAGIRPGTPLSEQQEEDLIWIREPFLSAEHLGDVRVVHGHTPGEQPVITPQRICLDTAAYATGRLTAARITPDGCRIISSKGA